MERPVVYLAGPRHSRQVDEGAARSFYATSARADKLLVYPRVHRSSILPQSFNKCWAEALTFRDDPAIGVTHFAMIHNDVDAEMWWLEKLWAVMQETGAQVVSTAIPIKDELGLVSCGGFDPDRRDVRRLTMHEMADLPEHFTADELPWKDEYPVLVVNTGLWLCDLRQPWCDDADDTGRLKMSFIFRSSIYKHEGKGQDGRTAYYATAESEDWLFSEFLWRQSVPVVATKAVKVTHHGDGSYPNYGDWGKWHTDHAAVAIKQTGTVALPDVHGIDDRPTATWKFPKNVPGWLAEVEGRALGRLAAGKKVLEIGAFCGKSTICMAQTAEQVVAVDTFEGTATLEQGVDTFTAFKTFIGLAGLADKVIAVRGLSKDVVPNIGMEFEPFDLAFIDGAHDYEAVATDIRLASEVLKPGGLIAFHDYRLKPGDVDGRWDPGVTKAVDELIAAGGHMLGCWGTVALVRPPAGVPVATK